MSDSEDDLVAVVMPKAAGARRSTVAVGAAGVLKGLGTGLAPADMPFKKYQAAPASSAKSSAPIRAERPARPSTTGFSDTSDVSEVFTKQAPYSAAKSAASVARSSAAPRGSTASRGFSPAAPNVRASAAAPRAVLRSRVIDDSDEDDDDHHHGVATGPYSRASAGAGPKPSYGIDPVGNAGSSAAIAKQRLVDTHTAIIEEHRAAIERAAERLRNAVEEVERFRALEAALLRDRLAELDAECDAELADLEAQFRQAQVQCRERYRARAEGERVGSERRVQERADQLMQMVNGGAGGGAAGGRRVPPIGVGAAAPAAGGGAGGEKFNALRAKAAAAAGGKGPAAALLQDGSDDDDA